MADEPSKNEEEQKQTSEGDTSPSSNQDGKEERDDWWESLESDEKRELKKEAKKQGFKSVSDFWKSYREASRKISTQGEELKEAEKFEKRVAPILNVVWGNKEILKRVRSELGGEQDNRSELNDAPSNNNGDEDKSPSPDLGTQKVLQEQIVNTFEANKGFDKLDDESRSEVRNILGGVMSKWAGPGGQIPIDKLGSYLEDAFDIASRRNDKLKSILEDVDTKEKNKSGEMSSTSSSGGDSGDTIKLTPEQREVADKMPGGVEAYKKGLEKLQKE